MRTKPSSTTPAGTSPSVVATVTVALALVAALAAPASAGPAGPYPGPDGETARAAFERFKQLAGAWQATSTQGWAERVSYEVIARGSAVVGRTEFRDAPDRTMLVIFTLDGDRLLLTHLCEARNQPRLVATEIDLEAGTVAFEFLDGGGIPTRDTGHMDAVVYRLGGADRFTSSWSWYQDGKVTWGEEVGHVRVED